MNTTSRTTLYEQERKYLFLAFACLVASVTLYIYFLSASVVHVVMRKEVDKEITTVHTVLSTLETEYIEAQHAVSEDIASLRGFTQTDKKIYIDRTETALVLSIN